MPVSDSDDALDDVFSSSRDRGADTAAPEPVKEAPKVEAETQQSEEPKADTPPAPDAEKRYRDPETGRFVPLHELTSERKKRQDEARLREEAEKRFQDLERRYQDLERRAQAPQTPPPPPPDPFTDPEGAFAYRDSLYQKQLFETRVMLGEEVLRTMKPDYDQVRDVFARHAQNDPNLAMQIVRAPNPARFAYEQGKRLMALEKIGDDYDGYEKRIREEERQKVLAELKQGGASSAPPQRFPGTLADATGSGAQGTMPVSDENMLADVFGSDRRQRRSR
jgi:hypothetical protein